ncbi:Putative dde superfamily endonuclease [Caligus rogercresseyi]|uniref:Dde superfamily endonuclease n=1 Tax=Caligus rogercresseyi TaxID=217165 RepID=A0A7T8GWB4_CALRO|nr:Putative dde superfamily endonuclease [Caligus rogercresseyi]
MNMLEVSRTFIWRTKKIIKEDGQTHKEAWTRKEAISEDTKADKAVAGKILHGSGVRCICEDLREGGQADLVMKPFKYRKMHLLNEATRVKRKARSSYCSIGTQDSPSVVVIFYDDKLFETTNKFNPQNDRILEHQKRLPDAEAGICDGLRGNGVKVNQIGYLDFLKTKAVPWIHEEFGGVPVCFQQDGAPAHTAKIEQD